VQNYFSLYVNIFTILKSVRDKHCRSECSLYHQVEGSSQIYALAALHQTEELSGPIA
jgi:hypothetical protein